MDFIVAHWLDITTTLLGLAYIFLEYKASKWMWAVGAVMQVLGIVLYYQKGLYADCGMEAYYLAMTAYGWRKWTATPAASPKGKGGYTSRAEEGSPQDTPPAPSGKSGQEITHIPAATTLRWGLIFGALWFAIWYLLAHFTDSTVPVADAFTTALSLVGVWALAHKYLEQWLVWIAVDVVTCWLYFLKDIPFKASLYGLYVIIAIAGYRRWYKLMQESTPPDIVKSAG